MIDRTSTQPNQDLWDLAEANAQELLAQIQMAKLPEHVRILKRAQEAVASASESLAAAAARRQAKRQA